VAWPRIVVRGQVAALPLSVRRCSSTMDPTSLWRLRPGERGQTVRDALEAGSVTITGAGGEPIEAYAAHPVHSAARPPTGGVVVIHHMPGFDPETKEITRRLASWGWSAVCPNLHQRDAPGAEYDDAAAASRAAGGVPDDRLVGDVGGAIGYLLDHPSSNGRVATIGFCSGGRQSVLSACAHQLAGAVDCYGAFVLSAAPADSGLAIAGIEDRLGGLSCPVLGLFGEDDANPSPAEVARLDALLTDLGKAHEFHSFEGAGHAFFAVNRAAYRPLVATDAWQLVREFLTQRLADDAGAA
jgi:carboxymethylenebutenolidase